MPDLSIACLLTAPALQERRRAALADFRAAQLELTGPVGTRELLAHELGFVREPSPSATPL
jgi:hypothetical protein